MKHVFLLFFLLVIKISFSQSKKEQIEILTNRVDSLNQVVSSQSRTINDKNSQISGLNTKITNLESSISYLNADINKLTLELQESKKEIATKAQEISNLQAQLKTKTDSLTFVLSELKKIKPAPTGYFKSVKIGSQTWMTENLNVSTFRNGDPIPQAKTAYEWEKAGQNKQPAWCYYDNNPANGAKYGRLYNWYAVNDPRGLAPVGYHIPSDAEWTKLEDYLGSDAGTKMKSTSGWEGNGNGTNSSGFNGLPGGFRSFNGSFYSIGGDGNWWSSTEINTSSAWYRALFYTNGLVSRHNFVKEEGFSVRCLRD